MGYVQGSMALGQSLVDVHSIIPRVAMVTPDVPLDLHPYISLFWTIVEVQPILCRTILSKSPHTRYPIQIGKDTFDFGFSNSYFENVERWLTTCTKFAAWSLTDYDSILFVDSDIIVTRSIDDIFDNYSNYSFVAASEIFPPDSFNAGFMYLKPSKKIFEYLLHLNIKVGSVEGHDQGVLNRGFCPVWYSGIQSKDNTIKKSYNIKCGKFPFKYNVPANKYKEYMEYYQRSSSSLITNAPIVLHFMSNNISKPWMILHYEMIGRITGSDADFLRSQGEPHRLWRDAYFRASGGTPPEYSIFYD